MLPPVARRGPRRAAAVPPPSPVARRAARRGAALLAAAVLALAACGPAAPPAVPRDLPGTPAPPGADAAPGGRALALTGRLVTVAARADGENDVAVRDLAAATTTALWTTGPEVADWRVDAGGRRAAYRAAIRSPRAAEQIELRELTPGALPRVVALVDPARGRLAGHAFSADGATLLYARQLVSEEGDAGGALELHMVGAQPGDEKLGSNDRLVSTVAAAPGGGVARTLIGWSSAHAVAVLREDGADGGPPIGLRFVPLAPGPASEAEPAAHTLAFDEGGGPALVGAAADAADAGDAAVVTADGAVWLARPGEAEPRPVAAAEREWAPVGAPRVGGGRWVAWTVAPAEGPSAIAIAALPAEGAAAPSATRALRPGEALAPWAWSPDGAWLLAGAGPPEALDPTGWVVVDPATGAVAPLPWPPPPGLWGADWRPALP